MICNPLWRAWQELAAWQPRSCVCTKTRVTGFLQDQDSESKGTRYPRRLSRPHQRLIREMYSVCPRQTERWLVLNRSPCATAHRGGYPAGLARHVRFRGPVGPGDAPPGGSPAGLVCSWDLSKCAHRAGSCHGPCPRTHAKSRTALEARLRGPRSRSVPHRSPPPAGDRTASPHVRLPLAPDSGSAFTQVPRVLSTGRGPGETHSLGKSPGRGQLWLYPGSAES